jgi:serine/threonine-protein kinase
MIRRRLGRGGMGTVYEAEDIDGNVVAIKTLATFLTEDEGLRRRFEAEIEVLKGLRHPGIVRLLSFGEEEGVPFFAMELVPGRSLEDVLKDGRRFSWRETIATAAAITRALKAAHDQGIVHRDLKPANLLLADESATDGGVKLADFGIARLFGETGHTQAGTVVGTAEYMAPEQATGAAVDHRADLYALGLVMFAMLAGKPPFRGNNVVDVLVKQRREKPPRVSTVAPAIPAALDQLIDKLLAKEPSARPASALSVGRLLDSIEREAETPAATSPHRASGGTIRVDRTLPKVDQMRTTRGTIPADRSPAATEPHAALPPAQDAKHAETMAFTPGDAGGSLAHRLTEADPAHAEQKRATTSRFTTVEDLDRSMRQEASREATRDAILKTVVGVVLTLGFAGFAYWLMRPLSADDLHARIMSIADDPSADLRDAKRSIDDFLARFADDPRATTIRELDSTLDLDALERRARRRLPKSAVPRPLERDYRAAMARESESPLACMTALEAILSLHKPAVQEPATPDEREDVLWLALVHRQIDRLKPVATRERTEDTARAAATLAEAASLAVQARTAAPPDQPAILARRRELLTGFVEMYAGRPHVASAVAEAKRLLANP